MSTKALFRARRLREAAIAIAGLKRSAGVFQFEFREDLEVASLMERLDRVLEAHNSFIDRHLKDNGIERIHGRARLSGENEIAVMGIDGSETTFEAEKIVIASGSRPRTPPGIPTDHENILDSDSILSMIYLPRSLTVLGGGVIACEYASIFSLLGVKVTMIDRTLRPLTFLDYEITDRFVSSFSRNGGRYLGEETVGSVRFDGVSEVITELESGEIIRSEKMLVAQGRLANVEGLGLAVLNIEAGSTRSDCGG